MLTYFSHNLLVNPLVKVKMKNKLMQFYYDLLKTQTLEIDNFSLPLSLTSPQ